ncbi:MAG: helix-turn-helix transcriptional regulator [Clostridia bacterium]|nr:helix-turn-helix transcriptional regulator [Clostridia bacterium]
MEHLRFKDVGNYTLEPLSYYIKKFTPEFYMGMHKHGYFEIMYAQRGSFNIELSTDPEKEGTLSTVTVNQGSFIFLDADLFHRLKIAEPEVVIYCIEFAPKPPDEYNPFEVNSVFPVNYKALLNKTNLKYLAESSSGYMVVPNLCNVDSALHNLIFQLSKQAKSVEDAYAVRLCILTLFSEIAKSIALFKENETYYTKKVYIYIKNHLNQKITLDDIASAVGYHKAYLTSQFKKQTGKTIMQMVCFMRISKSLQLLRDTNLSVTEIAEQVGFSSYTRMVCAFQKVVGLSPSACRKNFINDEIDHSTKDHQSSSVRISPEDYLLDDEAFYSSYYKKGLHSKVEELLKKY